MVYMPRLCSSILSRLLRYYHISSQSTHTLLCILSIYSYTTSLHSVDISYHTIIIYSIIQYSLLSYCLLSYHTYSYTIVYSSTRLSCIQSYTPSCHILLLCTKVYILIICTIVYTVIISYITYTCTVLQIYIIYTTTYYRLCLYFST